MESRAIQGRTRLDSAQILHRKPHNSLIFPFTSLPHCPLTRVWHAVYDRLCSCTITQQCCSFVFRNHHHQLRYYDSASVDGRVLCKPAEYVIGRQEPEPVLPFRDVRSRRLGAKRGFTRRYRHRSGRARRHRKGEGRSYQRCRAR